MDTNTNHLEEVRALAAVPGLAFALESEQFRHFLDQVPIAVVVSDIGDQERIVYANPEFEKLSGQSAAEVQGKPWSVLNSYAGESGGRKLAAAVLELSDRVGTFRIERTGRDLAVVDAYSNVIENEKGEPAFRLAAFVDVSAHGQAQREAHDLHIREKDTQLMEMQHRVKNNLQMITALVRIEARNAQGRIDTTPFDRLAGRIESIKLVNKLLSEHGPGDEIDLGVYLSEIVSGVMHSYAVEGIRLNLKLDTYPVSVNVAMPTGLVVNELLTNALKHAFVGRDKGTITVQSLADSTGCRVVVADDGIGLPQPIEWPKRGKLSALIVRSLRENAKADLKVESSPGNGTSVTIAFTRAAAAPEISEAARGQE